MAHSTGRSVVKRPAVGYPVRNDMGQRGRASGMTALRQYERLEAEALWRATPDAQRRAVFVSFGDATLTICDSAETPLAHWSLPAVERLNPGARPAIYAPDGYGSETLEIADPVMIEALETVRRALGQAAAQRGRLRRWMAVAAVAAVLAGMALWLPGALLSHAASMVPPVQRAEIGRRLLAEIDLHSGPACAEQQGIMALRRLGKRIMGEAGRIVVMPGRLGAPSLHLPGGIVILSQQALTEADGPELAAALVLAERLGAAREDPLVRLLRDAGPLAALVLLATREIDAEALAAHARHLAAAPPDPPPAADMRTALAAAGVPAAPYAHALDPTGETVRHLLEADPFAAGAKPPLLSDGDWVALEGICTP